jgi:hypothetical protein
MIHGTSLSIMNLSSVLLSPLTVSANRVSGGFLLRRVQGHLRTIVLSWSVLEIVLGDRLSLSALSRFLIVAFRLERLRNSRSLWHLWIGLILGPRRSVQSLNSLDTHITLLFGR